VLDLYYWWWSTSRMRDVIFSRAIIGSSFNSLARICPRSPAATAEGLGDPYDWKKKGAKPLPMIEWGRRKEKDFSLRSVWLYRWRCKQF
jgi:hypothetical protein